MYPTARKGYDSGAVAFYYVDREVQRCEDGHIKCEETKPVFCAVNATGETKEYRPPIHFPLPRAATLAQFPCYSRKVLFVVVTVRDDDICRIILARKATRHEQTGTTQVTVKRSEPLFAGPRQLDATRCDERRGVDGCRAVLPDAQPLTPEQLANMRRVSRVKVLRPRLGMTQAGICRSLPSAHYDVARLGAAPQHARRTSPCVVAGRRAQPEGHAEIACG